MSQICPIGFGSELLAGQGSIAMAIWYRKSTMAFTLCGLVLLSLKIGFVRRGWLSKLGATTLSTIFFLLSLALEITTVINGSLVIWKATPYHDRATAKWNLLKNIPVCKCNVSSSQYTNFIICREQEKPTLIRPANFLTWWHAQHHVGLATFWSCDNRGLLKGPLARYLADFSQLQTIL